MNDWRTFEYFARQAREALEKLNAATSERGRAYWQREIADAQDEIARMTQVAAEIPSAAQIGNLIDYLESRTDEERAQDDAFWIAASDKQNQINRGLSKDTVELPFAERFTARYGQGACIDER